MFQAALLLLFIAGVHAQPPTVVPPTPPPAETPPCVWAIARCREDAECAPLYAAFEGACSLERQSTPANCTNQCLLLFYALLSNPLGAGTMMCDCGSLPLLSAACRASRSNLRANCFPPPPPGRFKPFTVPEEVRCLLLHAVGAMHQPLSLEHVLLARICRCAYNVWPSVSGGNWTVLSGPYLWTAGDEIAISLQRCYALEWGGRPASLLH